MESIILDSFTKLADDKQSNRIFGGIALLKHFSKIEDNEKHEKEFNYSIKRLIRGVGSSRQNARKGFYSTLVALLETSSISVSQILETLDKESQTSSSRSERGDISVGQILTCGAIIRSQRFDKISLEEQHKIINILFSVSKLRSYLPTLAFTFIRTLIDNLNEDKFKEILWPILKIELGKSRKEQTLDTIYILFQIRNKFPNTVKSSFLKKHIESPEIVHSEFISSLCEIVLNIPMIIYIQHPFYNDISESLIKSDCVESWCTEIDKQLFKSTYNKQIIVTVITTKIIEKSSTSSFLPDLLTPKFIQSIINFMSTNKKSGDDLAKRTIYMFKQLITKLLDAEVETEIKISVLKKLLFFPGNFLFEKVTGLKIIQQLTASLNNDGVKELLELYRGIVVASTSKLTTENKIEPWLNNERSYAANLLTKLLGHPAVQNEVEWRFNQIVFLLDLYMFGEIKVNQPIGIELSASLKECFFHALDHKLPKLDDLRNLLSKIIHYIEQKLSDSENLCRNPLTDEYLETWQSMCKLLQKIEQKKKSKQNYAIPVFHTLLMHMGLQLFTNPKFAKNSIEELQNCYVRIGKNKSEIRNKNVKEGDIIDEEPEWIEVIIDLFLSLLSRNSHLMRNIINCVFPYLCPHLNINTLQQILNIYDPDNDDTPLIDESEEDSENESTNESDSEEEESDENESENETVSDKLRMAIQSALGGSLSDTESVDLDDMDEEEGERLDKALSEAFKSARGNKGHKSRKQTVDEKNLMHFRVRALDLIDMYIDSIPPLSIVLEIMQRLLLTLEFTIRNSHQKPLELRIRSSLKKLASLKKASTDDIDVDMFVNVFNSLLEQGNLSAPIYQDMSEILAECSLFLIRCSQIIEENKNIKMQSIAVTYKNLLETFFKKRDCLVPIVLFKKTFQICWDGNWELVPIIIECAFDNTIRPFRRNQAIDLLTVFYRNHRFLSEGIEKHKKDIAKIEKELNKRCLDVFICATNNTKEIKEKFVCSIMTLLVVVKQFYNNANTKCFIDWNLLKETITNYRSNVVLTNDSKKAFRKLCDVLGVSIANLNKNKIIQTDNTNGFSETLQQKTDDESECEVKDEENLKKIKKERKKKQKAKSMKKDIQKLKKETREARVEAMSEGLEMLSFSKMSNLNLEETDDEDENEVKSKSPIKRKNEMINGKTNGNENSNHIIKKKRKKITENGFK